MTDLFSYCSDTLVGQQHWPQRAKSCFFQHSMPESFVVNLLASNTTVKFVSKFLPFSTFFSLCRSREPRLVQAPADASGEYWEKYHEQSVHMPAACDRETGPDGSNFSCLFTQNHMRPASGLQSSHLYRGLRLRTIFRISSHPITPLMIRFSKLIVVQLVFRRISTIQVSGAPPKI